MHDPVGSRWRKWDLHIHTPASYHWTGKKFAHVQDKDEKNVLVAEVLRAINSTDIAVFGIMDYWTFDGYLAIRDYLDINPNLEQKTIFPGMELRLESPTEYRLNIHVILSDKVSRQGLLNFKNSLQIDINGKLIPLSEEGLISVARFIAPDKANEYGYGDPENLSEQKALELGSMTAVITKDSFRKALKTLDGQALVMLPFSPYNGLEQLNWRKHPVDATNLMRFADIIEERQQSYIDLFLNRETDQNKGFIDNFIRTLGEQPKPCVSGSDAHKVGNYGNYPSGRATWIKADITFDGLMQVVNEPVGRSFVGEIPPEVSRVNSNRTKYIKSIAIRKKTTSELDEIWFDNVSLPLNTGLVAIIGNKGSGKSALTDVLGLLGNTKRSEHHYSFLTESRFRSAKLGGARHFEATMTWHSDIENIKGLHESASDETEKVTYIPQAFFETICNETEIVIGGAFDKELKKVIFSHVKDADRLGQDNLESLIRTKTDEVRQTIVSLRADLTRINEEVINLEDQLTDTYRETIKQKIEHLEKELEVHVENPPPIVEKPEEDSEIAEELSELKTGRDDLVKEREDVESDQRNQKKKNNALVKLLQIIERFENEFQSIKRDAKDELQLLGLNIEQLIEISVNKEPLNAQLQEVDRILEANTKSINELEIEISGIDDEIKKHQGQLDETEQAYQKYLESLNDWQEQTRQIIGTKDENGTKAYYEKKLDDLDNVIPVQYEEAKKDRKEKVHQIFGYLQNLISIYSDLYHPVQDFIENHSLVRDRYKLNFDVSIEISPNFTDRFFDYIRQNVRGSFQGKDEGEKLLKELIGKSDFNSDEGVMIFVETLLDYLTYDNRHSDEKKKMDVKRQLSPSTDLQRLYDFLFSLEYLHPNYALKLDGKDITRLSPGERGILLLIFYLLVDQDKHPLIIDQPEENLDNQSVYELLVPCIKEAKQNRQIIIVTHNPNLAVVCDADQIIYASIDKTNGMKVSYQTGSIENPEIKNRVVDVLEGTKPAFIKRDKTYGDMTT